MVYTGWRVKGAKIKGEFPEFQESQMVLGGSCLEVGSRIAEKETMGELIWVPQNQIFEGSLKRGYVVLGNETEGKERTIWSSKGGYVGPGRRV